MNRHGLLQHSLARFIRRWHARLGLTAALFFIVLVVTGVALNHTERLGLALTPIRSEALNHWYGLPSPRILAVYPDASLVATPEAWLYRGRALPEGGGAVVGAVTLPDMLVVATAQSLNLYTLTGERIDTLSAAALPQRPLTGLSRSGNAMALRTPTGVFTSMDGVSWQTTPDTGLIWVQASAPDTLTVNQIRQKLTPSLPLERIMLDLHSGRLLGHYGPFFMDAAALILAMLALSGIWIQWRNWRQRRRHPHRS